MTVSETSGTGLRVVLACDWFVKYTAALARGLVECGSDVTLLTRDRTGELRSEASANGNGVLGDYVARVLGDTARHRELPGRVRDRSAVPAVARVRREIRALRPQVVHVQESVLDDPRLLLAAGILPGRYAVTFHDPTPHPGDPIPRLRRRVGERELLRHAGLIFVHSEVDRVELRKAFRTRAPIEVVPHGTGTPAPTPLPAEPVMLFFGRILPYKGLAVLLDALPAIWRALPGARLVIAGAGELPEHRLLEDPRVELHHRHVREDEIRGLFGAARVVALPYTQASQSGVGSQAKIYGRPTVVTSAGGLPELVSDGSGLVVPPGDAAALAETLVDVMATPGRAETLAERAVAGAKAADWPRVAEQTLEAYRRHLPGARA